MRLSTYNMPRIIACAEDHPKHVGLPRGCLDELLQTLSGLNIKPVVQDQRNLGQPLKTTFQGELRAEQAVAAQAMLAHDTGVLAATTAFGKTVVAAWLMAQRGVNTLVLVHRRQLQQQWIERLSTFLEMPAHAIGRIGGGRKKPTGLASSADILSNVRSFRVGHRDVVRTNLAMSGTRMRRETRNEKPWTLSRRSAPLAAVATKRLAARSSFRAAPCLTGLRTCSSPSILWEGNGVRYRSLSRSPILSLQCGRARRENSGVPVHFLCNASVSVA
jgi:hypothetical protein